MHRFDCSARYCCILEQLVVSQTVSDCYFNMLLNFLNDVHSGLCLFAMNYYCMFPRISFTSLVIQFANSHECCTVISYVQNIVGFL